MNGGLGGQSAGGGDEDIEDKLSASGVGRTNTNTTYYCRTQTVAQMS